MSEDLQSRMDAQDTTAQAASGDNHGVVELDDAVLEDASGGNFIQDAWNWFQGASGPEVPRG